MYATKTIRSHSKPEYIYAEINEQVTVLSTSLHVAICEAKKGRFPVLVELLSDEQVVIVVEEPEVVMTDQLSLF